MTNKLNIEKHSFKISIGVAISVILFLLACAMNLATWKTTIENEIKQIDSKQDHLTEKYINLNERITELEEENTNGKVQIAKIETRLINIEALLIEIKKDLNREREK